MSMDEQKLDACKEDFALLIEAGFVAVKQLDEMSATRIFHAAQVLNPDSMAPQIGLGYIALNKLEIREATKIFEGVLKKEPENYLAQTFLGMCFLLNEPKRKKGEQLIHEAMEKTTDVTIKNLGVVSLEWAEKDLSRQTSRFPKNKTLEEENKKEEERETAEKFAQQAEEKKSSTEQ